MSHPLIVEAAETLFVPVCIHNNTKGDADDRVRQSFEEPAWNNPVVRIIAANREDLVPRIANRWTVAALAEGMVRALAKAKQAVPGWLRMLASETRAQPGLETAIFGMG